MTKAITFEEATAEYTAMTGEIPTLNKMIELYHHYRKTLKDYEWKSFNEFMKWNS